MSDALICRDVPVLEARKIPAPKPGAATFTSEFIAQFQQTLAADLREVLMCELTPHGLRKVLHRARAGQAERLAIIIADVATAAALKTVHGLGNRAVAVARSAVISPC